MGYKKDKNKSHFEDKDDVLKRCRKKRNRRIFSFMLVIAFIGALVTFSELKDANAVMIVNERNLELQLSQSDYDAIFYLDGNYKIEDWNNQDEIDAMILEMILDEMAQERMNISDADVPTSKVKNKIYWIAERYNDIGFSCDENDLEYKYAEKLRIAYEHTADMLPDCGNDRNSL